MANNKKSLKNTGKWIPFPSPIMMKPGMKRWKKDTAKADSFKITPVIQVIPAVPISSTESLSKKMSFSEAAKNSARISAAIKKVKPIIEELFNRLEKGDESAVYAIAQFNSSLLTHPKVKEVTNKWYEQKQWSKLGKIERGRKPGRPQKEDLHWLIYFLVESLRRKERTLTEIFTKFSESGVGRDAIKTYLSEETIRDIYYKYSKKHNYDPYVLWNEKAAVTVTRKEYEEMFGNAIQPKGAFEIRMEIDGKDNVLTVHFGK